MHFISSTLCFVLVLTLVAICDGYAYGMGTGLGGMSVKDAKVVALRKICQNRGFLWPVFSRIRAALIRESTSQRKPVFWNISRTVIRKLTHHGYSQDRSRHSNVFFEIASKFRSCTQVFFRKTILKDWALFSWKNPSVLFSKFTSSKPKNLFKKVSALGIFGNSMQVFRQVVSRNTSMSVVKIRREHPPNITLENNSSKIFEKISSS